MKLKNSKHLVCYQEYDRTGWYVEGASNLKEAAEYLNNKYLDEDQGVYKESDGRIARLHKCLDCDMAWEHSGDYMCGECGEYRLSKNT